MIRWFCGLGVFLLAACGDNGGEAHKAEPQDLAETKTIADISHHRLVAADAETGNWLTHGRTYAEERFSPLKQINEQTVSGLGLAWYHDFDTSRGQEATPLVVDGVMYTTSAWSKVQSFNAVTGELLWQYDPEVPGKAAVKACCDVVNRGVALWQGKVYAGTIDGRLIALDAKTGALVWETLTVDQNKPYTITGAPRVVKGKVLIGNGGAEFGVRGYISAYDTETGAMVWRFYTVPGNPDDGVDNPIHAETVKTWNGEWWKLGGGGTVWDSMAYDPELDLLYIGVGNGSPWNQNVRSPGGGDNLFLSSIVALKPDTGAYVWHYQTTPADMWDYTATQQMILADLEIKGQPRKVLMQAPKNGFFYVLDRVTGELLSAEPFVPLNWASHVDMETGRPVVTPEAYYTKTGKPWLAFPGPLGAHTWHSMSLSKETGLVYIPAQVTGFPFAVDKNFKVREQAFNLGIDLMLTAVPQEAEAKKAVMNSLKGYLLAWDPVQQKAAWRIENPGPVNGGTLSTAGNLVFQGTGAGTFNAYHAATGEKLWSTEAQTGVIAAPVSYEMDGDQYIAVLAGWGGVFPLATGELAHIPKKQVNRSRLLVFKLGGKESLPLVDDYTPPVPDLPDRFGDTETVQLGAELYMRLCANCHGDSVVSGGVLPDLRYSYNVATKDDFSFIVLDGALTENGMVSFEKEISRPEAEAIRAYIISRGHDTRD